jgi:hypothetical protein
MGSAVFLPPAQAVFQNQLLKAVRRFLPGNNPFEVLAAGANSAAVHSFSQDVIPDVLRSYAWALRFTFALGVPLAGVSLLASFFMPWFKYHNESLKKPEDNNSEKAANLETATTEVSAEKSSEVGYRPKRNAQ